MSSAAAPARTRQPSRISDFPQRAAQPDHHARHAAIAHDQVGPDTDNRHRHAGRLLAQKGLQVFDIGRTEQHFRRPTRPKPREIAHRRIRRIGAAHLGKTINQAHRATTPQMSWSAKADHPRLRSVSRRGWSAFADHDEQGKFNSIG
ncbi:MAG: hypothetical protein QM698_14875 [Micropepsaceae bacterium]